MEKRSSVVKLDKTNGYLDLPKKYALFKNAVTDAGMSSPDDAELGALAVTCQT